MTPQQLKAMKQALEALKLLTGAWQTFGALDYGDNAITALEEALAEHAMREVQRLGQEIEQEPVAWLDGPHLVVRSDMRDRLNYKGPWVDLGRAIPDKWTPLLYTHPPQRTWVGLTDEEIEQSCVPLGAAMLSFTEVARAIEAKLKEKNT